MTDYTELYAARVVELEIARGKLQDQVRRDGLWFTALCDRHDQRRSHWWGRFLWWLIRKTT